jgi:hypothetical protein
MELRNILRMVGKELEALDVFVEIVFTRQTGQA